jgi:hypothetical protein
MRSTELSWDEQARADAGRLWAGGVVTAIVAAGVALVAVMVTHKLMHVTLLNPDGSREAADDAMVMLPLLAAIVTLFATGLLHLLMTTTPQAPQFFAWIGALLMALVLLEVYFSADDVKGRVATGAVYLLLGVVIISSLSGVGRTAVRYHRRQAYRENDGYRGDGYRGDTYRGDAYRYEQEPRRYR